MPEGHDRLVPFESDEVPTDPRGRPIGHAIHPPPPHASLTDKLRHQWRRFTKFVSRRWPDGARIVAWTGVGAGAATALLIVGFFTALGLYRPDVQFDGDLYALNRPSAFVFKDAKGETIGRRGAVTGERLALKDMPAYLPAAFLAMEDRRFHEHGGIDSRGFIRALVANFQAGRYVQGGSTITQQLARMLFLSRERTIRRKLEEMAIARDLEARLSKNEILELYLNRVYLGSGAYGVDGAARVYFGKSARHLTLPEAAMLASLTRAPSVFSPRRDLARAQKRAVRVLNAMVETGAITDAQLAQARARPATVLAQAKTGDPRNYFFDAAADEAQHMIGSQAGDFVVTVTMDPKLQAAAVRAVARVLDRQGRRFRASQAALVAMERDGAVRAIVGGRDYADSAFNRATRARRQPGSAFKPFVYLTAFEAGLDTNSLRSDEPMDFGGGYMPANYHNRHSGLMTLHRALVHSVNTIAVQLCMEVGPATVAAVARRLGIRSPLQPYASLALGTSEVTPMELTAAFAAFPTGGLRVEPYMVTEVRTLKGEVLYRRDPPQQQRVIAQEKALWMNALLYDVVQSGTGRAAAVPRHEVAGKTGTSSDFRDAWFVGYSAELIAGVWVGNDNSQPMREVTGGKLPAQIWAGFMRTALSGRRPLQIARDEPEAPFMMAGLNSWGDVSVGDWDYAVGENDAAVYPTEPYRESSRDPVRWMDEDEDEEVARPAPPPRVASLGVPTRPRRELQPRAVQEDGEWVGAQSGQLSEPQAQVPVVQPPKPQVHTAPPDEPRRYTKNRREDSYGRFPPNRYGQSGRTEPTRVAEEQRRPRVMVDASEDGPAHRTVRRSMRREREWNPPPRDAAIPPPNTPPPRETYPMPEDDYDSWLYE
jgi:penicillin-binding protein 1A